MNLLSSSYMSTSIIDSIQTIREPLHILNDTRNNTIHVLLESEYQSFEVNIKQSLSHIGLLPALYPEWLGSTTFLTTHRVRFPYIVGEMANGIASAKMVIAAAQAGLLGFFGAAGLSPQVVEQNLQTIYNVLGPELSWGVNLIHSPQEPALEQVMVNLFLQYGIRRVSASAYMNLTPVLVQYACTGLSVDSEGFIQRQNYVFAKISRPEVAKHFMQPAPTSMLDELVRQGKLTHEEARLAAHIPVAEDITIEADSGGHTDNRPLTALFPIILQLAEQMEKQYQYRTSIRVGAAGGLGTPSSLAAAFSLGAAYVLTGSINQAAVESGLSHDAKEMLASVGIADVMMAAAADMFEIGVKLQVLKRGTFFGSRANKLYEMYTKYDSLEAIPELEKVKIEEDIFRAPLEKVWQSTEQFFNERDPEQITKAQENPKHKMALTFRWYLGLASHWAIQGQTDRKTDYQIWCGPAMGAFNEWVAKSFLESLTERTVAQIAFNLLEGAAVSLRAQQVRAFGLRLPLEAFNYRPRFLI